MAGKILSSSITLKRRVKDVSFKSLFLEFFVKYLIVFVIISSIIIAISYKYSEKYYKENLNNILNETIVKISELQTNEIPLTQKNTRLNYTMANAREKLLENAAIKDVTLFLYNMDQKKDISGSGAFVVYDDENFINWYKDLCKNGEYIIPETVITDQLLDFCDKNPDTSAIRTSFVNKSLLLEEVKSSNGKTMEEKRADEQRELYEQEVKFSIIGNRKTDNSFIALSSYSFVEDEESDLGIDIKYNDVPNGIKIESKNFNLSNVNYRLDIAYNYNFLFAIAGYLIPVELGLLLLCAGIAFLKAKQDSSRY